MHHLILFLTPTLCPSTLFTDEETEAGKGQEAGPRCMARVELNACLISEALCLDYTIELVFQ